MDGICQLFEVKLKQSNPDRKNIEYSVSDLFSWIDGLTDLSCLVYVFILSLVLLLVVRLEPITNEFLIILFIV